MEGKCQLSHPKPSLRPNKESFPFQPTNKFQPKFQGMEILTPAQNGNKMPSLPLRKRKGNFWKTRVTQ